MTEASRVLWLPARSHAFFLQRWLQRAMTKPIFHSLRVAQRQEHRRERCRYVAPIARGGGRLYVETYAAAPRRSTYGSIRTIHRNRRYEREERRLSHDAAEKKNTKGRGGGITAIQAATDLGGHSKAATCCWSLSLTLTG